MSKDNADEKGNDITLTVFPNKMHCNKYHKYSTSVFEVIEVFLEIKRNNKHKGAKAMEVEFFHL